MMAHLSSTPLFDSGEHPAAAVSELGVLSLGMVLNEERVVLLDGREPDALTVWDLNNGFRLTTFSHTGDVLYVAEVGGDGDKRTIVEFPGAESSDVLFGHRTFVSIGNDRVAVADTESMEVMILDQSGTLVSSIPMPGERLRVSEDHLAARLGAAGEQARRSHERRVELLEAMGRSTEGFKFEGRDYRHNEIAPAIDRMQFDGDGRLWMRHYVMPGADTKSWTVWDGGSTTFSVDMPASENLLDVRGSLVLLRIRSELGVDRAVIRELVFR